SNRGARPSHDTTPAPTGRAESLPAAAPDRDQQPDAASHRAREAENAEARQARIRIDADHDRRPDDQCGRDDADRQAARRAVDLPAEALERRDVDAKLELAAPRRAQQFVQVL